VATIVYKNAMALINGVDLSASISSLSLQFEAESLDETAMGDATRKRRGGLKSQGMDITFHQKFTCVDATLFGIVGCQSCIELRPCSTNVGDANPRFQGTWHLPRYSPMSGAVGSLLDATVTFEPAGDLSRSVTAT